MLFNNKGEVILKTESRYPDDNYNSLKKEALNCQRCNLYKGASQVVMGEGTATNKLMFIGEGPGADEDRLGRPFVGRAGKLLNRILSAAKIKREEVYITNIVKCRPPYNRAPEIKESDCCTAILAAEIKIIDPKVIVPLGSTALRYLIDEQASITRMRGKWIQRGKYYFLPTFHPSYLLRNEHLKKYVWRDFIFIKKAINRINELKSSGEL